MRKNSFLLATPLFSPVEIATPVDSFDSEHPIHFTLSLFVSGAYNAPQLMTNNSDYQSFVDLRNDTAICSTCDLILDLGTATDSALWQDGSKEIRYSATQSETYSVTIWENGCENKDTISVQKKQVLIIVPNAFTPNGDGLNDEFKIVQSQGIIHFEMRIFNRWGRLIFKSRQPDRGWNGRYQGNNCSTDSYAWQIAITYQDGETGQIKKKSKMGTVMLLR